MKKTSIYSDVKTRSTMNIDLTPHEIVFLIPTCAKYADKTKAVRNTWVKQLAVFGFRYLFLMGKPDLKQASIENDVLYVPCRDDYESLLLKLVLGYEFLYQNMHFKYVYKIDDDCFPNLKILVKEILPQLANKKYVGGAIHPSGTSMSDHWHFGKCSDPKFDKPYKFKVAPFDFAKGGYGYFLRKDILPLLFDLIEEQRADLTQFSYSPEDVRIAEVLKEHNIGISSFDNYTIISGSSYNNAEQYLVYDITSPELMKRIQEQRFETENVLKSTSQVETVESQDHILFIVHPKNNNKKVAFYLYKNNKHIDTQWYSKNMSYTLDKKLHGKGEYKITYFIVDENDEDPGKSENKEIGTSRNITIGST